jgi:hypothetical protein
MKLKNIILAGAAISSLCVAQASFAFTAVTDTAADINSPGTGGAQVGDTFTVTGGNFASYLPTQSGDPTITGNDLNLYHFSLQGTVTSVNPTTEVVSYSGFYQIYYQQGSSVFDLSTGILALTVNFGAPTAPNVYAANGVLTQTGGPSPGFPSNGFPESSSAFTGVYIQDANDANGSVQGTISTPDATSTLGLLGVSAVGLLAFNRRKVTA